MSGELTESEYWQEVQFLSTEVEGALTIYLIYEEINHLSVQNRSIFEVLNRDALFWNTLAYSLQTSLFIILGRIFDSSPDSRSIDKLLSETLGHLHFFSKEALTARKMGSAGKPEWLESFVASAWFPNGPADLRFLKKRLVPYRKKFENVYRPIRHSIFAHRLLTQNQGITLFAATNRGEVGQILDFLHDLMFNLENLYLNGCKPQLGARADYHQHYKQIVRAGVEKMLLRLATAPEP